jgi:class I fructose-bisphosphate aldolase
MQISATVKKILGNYESDNPGTKASLARMLTHGRLANTGRMIILPVDQGFEHGPGRSFGMNPAAYDPHYHYQLATEAGVSAFAAPLGLLEAGADTFAGAVPTILKMNSSNTLVGHNDQAITSSVRDALRLGCSAIGFTIYPGSDDSLEMFEEIQTLSEEAKACGLAVIIWSYPRGNMSSEGETSLNVIAYGAHMAALLGAHIIKVKLPTDHIEHDVTGEAYKKLAIPRATLAERVRHIVQACFNGRRMVVFSGGAAKDDGAVLVDAKAIHEGGGNGSIIGRNAFQRPKNEGLMLLENIAKVYLS